MIYYTFFFDRTWLRDFKNLVRNIYLTVIQTDSSLFRNMFLCSTTFRFHTYTSFRTSCTNTMRISASTCRYSRFNHLSEFDFNDSCFRFRPNGDGRGNCVVIIKRSPACKLQVGLWFCFESACYETSMALVTFSFGSVFGMVMVRMPSSTLAEILSFTTSSGST